MNELCTNYHKIKLELKELSKNQSEGKEVQLVVVTKRKKVELVSELFDEGQIDFGENYVQEWKDKYEVMKSKNVRWHFIGQLQSNKVKVIVGKVYLIHSVNSIKLLKEINKRAVNSSCIQNILLQVSFDQSSSRGGVGLNQLRELLDLSLELENVCVKGLMAVPPINNVELTAREYFRELHSIKNQLSIEYAEKLNHFDELSMGMSGDYRDAIEEGASIVRIGSLIVGSRD